LSAAPVPVIEVHGAGPAGSAAAISARLAGAEVDLYDPSHFPHHKVCGEFLSPEAIPILEALGLAGAFEDLHPARYSHLVLRFGPRMIRSPLPEPAYGISRHSLDQLLLDRALSLGVRLHRERAPEDSTLPTVVAHGRQGPHAASTTLPRGRRLFGFKAHFNGSPADPLTLFFAGRTYVGINAVENGVINVCGIAPEDDLHRTGFDIDAYLQTLPVLAALVKPLSRSMAWLRTGPFLYAQRFQPSGVCQYPAGDALSFIDPFTGSGLLSALLTGRLAGLHAAHSVPATRHLQLCRQALGRPFFMASIVRKVLATPLAWPLAVRIPARWLILGTRPAAVNSFKI